MHCLNAGKSFSDDCSSSSSISMYSHQRASGSFSDSAFIKRSSHNLSRVRQVLRGNEFCKKLLHFLIAGVWAEIFNNLSGLGEWKAIKSWIFILGRTYGFLVCCRMRMAADVNNTRAPLSLCCAANVAFVVFSGKPTHFRAAAPFAFFILQIFIIFYRRKI